MSKNELENLTEKLNLTAEAGNEFARKILLMSLAVNTFLDKLNKIELICSQVSIEKSSKETLKKAIIEIAELSK